MTRPVPDRASIVLVPGCGLYWQRDPESPCQLIFDVCERKGQGKCHSDYEIMPLNELMDYFDGVVVQSVDDCVHLMYLKMHLEYKGVEDDT